MIQLPFLLLPSVLAAIISFCSSNKIGYIITLFSLVVTLFFSLTLEGDTIQYVFGGWTRPYGIEIEISAFIPFFISFMTIIGISSLCVSKHIKHDIETQKYNKLFSLFLLYLTSNVGLLMSNDVFNIYVFLEISSITAYALIASSGAQSKISAYNYLIIGTIAATLYLLSVFLIYAITGSLNITDIYNLIHLDQSSNNTSMLNIACLLMYLGIIIKTALFPMHIWMISGYRTAPNAIINFMSAVGTKVPIFLLIKLNYSIFGIQFLTHFPPLLAIKYFFAPLAIIYGAWKAYRAQYFKELLAYSSISQIGYMFLAITLLQPLSTHVALFHIISHGTAKSALFMLSGIALYQGKNDALTQFHGWGRSNILLGILLLVNFLSMLGVPMTAGFINKWGLINALIQNTEWYLIIIMCTGSVIAILYNIKFFELCFSKPKKTATYTQIPLSLILPIIFLSIMIIVLGIYPELINVYIEKTVQYLHNK